MRRRSTIDAMWAETTAQDAVARVLAASSEPSLVITADDRIVCANAAAARELNRAVDLLPGQRLADVDPMHVAHNALRTRLGDGRTLLVLRATVAAPIATPATDIGDAPWLDGMARFAGGIAHDYNNLLTIIAGNLQLIDMRLDDARLKPQLREADLACAMAARQTQRLLTFARQRRLTAEPTDVNDVIRTMVDVVAKPLDDRVTLISELAPSLPFVRVDRSELESALLNLIMNAFDAMPNGGSITLTSAHDTEATGTPVVAITVADTGTGMSEDVRSRALEPFFTTKGADRGSGLGLAIVHGFVSQSGGRIVLTSSPGAGTRVQLVFPALAD